MTKMLYRTLGGFLLGIGTILGQNVGIGTSSPHSSARLHIQDTQRGLLIPNVSLSSTNSATPISGPATSLLVYNTATSGSFPTNVWPGFYYWDGTKWVRLLAGSGTSGDAWLLRGNSGTNPTVNFIGTTDNVALEVRVNNVRALRIEPASTPNLIGGYSGNSVTGGVIGATIGGGGANNELNSVTDNYGTVGGGANNRAGDNAGTTSDAYYATVSGGYGNQASDPYATVGGGYLNIASSFIATIGGGYGNQASNAYATIGGGYLNIASGFIATIGGGARATAIGTYAIVGGGLLNTASGYGAIVGGGIENTASSQFATVGGGQENIASGDYSVVLGGSDNRAKGHFNLVFGAGVDPSTSETHRVYFFGDGSTFFRPSGFLVINRLDGDHPIHVGTNTNNGNGAHLTTGGTWTSTSSRSFKEHFTPLHTQEVLQKIIALPVEGWYYKGTQEYHIGPYAEDFYAAFGTGVHEIIETDSTGKLVRRPNPEVGKYLAAIDVAGVALLGVKALAEGIGSVQSQQSLLEQRVEALQRENQRLRQQLEQVMERLALVEAQLQQRQSGMAARE